MILPLLPCLLAASPTYGPPIVQDDGAAPLQAADGMTQAELEALSEEIRAEVAELRGEQYLRPVAVAVTDREGFLTYARRRMAETTSPEELAALEDAAKLMGVLPPDMDYLATTMKLLEEQVGGFYDPAEDKFFLMSSFGGDLARIILAHELTHALDDQLFDIDGTLAERLGNSDAVFAYQAVVEGSGTATMNRWTIEHMAELDPRELAKSGDMGMEAMKTAPPFLWKPLLAAYFKGAAFLARTESVLMGQMAALSPADIRRAFTDVPRSSEQILHPDKYWNEETRDEPVEVAAVVAALPDGWSLSGEDTLGELGLAFVVEPLEKRKGLAGQMAVLGARFTNPAAEGWGGDRFVLLGKGDARVLVLGTVWDSPAEAEEFRAALETFAEHLDGGAASLARLRGLSGSGHAVREVGGVLRLEVWIGAGGEELSSVLAAVDFTVAPGSTPAGDAPRR